MPSHYVLGKTPAMIEIFKWAEGSDQPTVTDAALDLVAGAFIDGRQQGGLQFHL